MNFETLPIFDREFKKLSKKYKSLESDLLEFEKIIKVFPTGRGRHFVRISGSKSVSIIKARLFGRYLKGSSLRIIYAYHEESEMIEFIEIYFKSDRENEDTERIKHYLKSL